MLVNLCPGRTVSKAVLCPRWGPGRQVPSPSRRGEGQEGGDCSKQSAGSVARIALVQTNMGSPGGQQASFNLLAIRTEVQTRVKEQPGKPAAAARSALTSPVHRSCRGVQLFLQPKVANLPHTSHISGMPLMTLLTRRSDLHLSLGFAIEKPY